jgi:hypothetical protein
MMVAHKAHFGAWYCRESYGNLFMPHSHPALTRVAPGCMAHPPERHRKSPTDLRRPLLPPPASLYPSSLLLFLIKKHHRIPQYPNLFPLPPSADPNPNNPLSVSKILREILSSLRNAPRFWSFLNNHGYADLPRSASLRRSFFLARLGLCRLGRRGKPHGTFVIEASLSKNLPYL